MKKKFRLWLNIVTICLCIAAITIGVYAATSATLTIQGQIGFKAHNCQVLASGTVYGHAKTSDATLTTYYKKNEKQAITFGANNDTTATIGGTNGVSTGSFGTLRFTDLAEATIPDIVVCFKFKNESAYQITATIYLTQEITNLTYTRTYKKGTETGKHEDALILDAQAEVEFTIIFNVAEPNKNIGDETHLADLQIMAEFRKYNEQAPGTQVESSGLTYTLNDNKSSWSLSATEDIQSTVTIPATVNGLPITIIDKNVFAGKLELTSISLPSTITTISANAFNGCEELKTINLPNSLTKIDDNAFLNCFSLKDVEIPASVINISTTAFDNIANNTNFKVTTDINEDGCEADYWGTDSNPYKILADLREGNSGESYSIKEGTEIINAKALYGQANISEIILSNSITTIGDYAFYDCQSLLNITITESVKNIGDNAFNYCLSLNSITFKQRNLTQISLMSFGCSFGEDLISLNKIYIPATSLSEDDAVYSAYKALFEKFGYTDYISMFAIAG